MGIENEFKTKSETRYENKCFRKFDKLKLIYKGKNKFIKFKLIILEKAILCFKLVWNKY